MTHSSLPILHETLRKMDLLIAALNRPEEGQSPAYRVGCVLITLPRPEAPDAAVSVSFFRNANAESDPVTDPSVLGIRQDLLSLAAQLNAQLPDVLKPLRIETALSIRIPGMPFAPLAGSAVFGLIPLFENENTFKNALQLAEDFEALNGGPLREIHPFLIFRDGDLHQIYHRLFAASAREALLRHILERYPSHFLYALSRHEALSDRDQDLIARLRVAEEAYLDGASLLSVARVA